METLLGNCIFILFPTEDWVVHSPEADYGESRMSFVILLLHSHELQSTDN